MEQSIHISIVTGVDIYAWLGLALSIFFLGFGIHRTNENARGSYMIRVLLLPVVMLLSGCASDGGEPELALIYNASASYHSPDRNPIIAMPGLMGSKLRDRESDKLVWGAFDRTGISPETSDGFRLISLPVGDGELPLARLVDAVEPDGVLDRARISLLGIPIELEVYAGILGTLGVGGYVDQSLGLGGDIDYGTDHYTCFQFPYDWRRDIVESARLLHRFLDEKRAYVRQQYLERFGVDRPELKFDIVTHSMGGLVTRYFLRYGSQDLPADGSLPELTWAGARYIERVIFVGTPNAGSVNALQNLVMGREIGPFVPLYPPALVGTFPSAYQLLPRSRHGLVVWDKDVNDPVTDLFDPALWERLQWGLAAPGSEDKLAVLMPERMDLAQRRARALRFQAQLLRRAKAFMAAIDRPASPPPGLELFLVAGDGHPTPEYASIDPRTGELSIISSGEGDGTVLRTSALLDERRGGTWQPQVTTPLDFDWTLFLPEEHVNLTKSRTFQDNVLYWLLEDPRGAGGVPR